MPDEETLRKCLELAWLDHFQTRAQTWKTLQIEAVLVAALVGIDWRLENIFATTGFAIFLIIASQFGSLITLRHRNDTEIRKFEHIINLERKLGLLKPDLLDGVEKPKEIRWLDIFKFGRSNTSLFILRMHVTIQAFALIYLVFAVVKYCPVVKQWFV